MKGEWLIIIKPVQLIHQFIGLKNFRSQIVIGILILVIPLLGHEFIQIKRSQQVIIDRELQANYELAQAIRISYLNYIDKLSTMHKLLGATLFYDGYLRDDAEAVLDIERLVRDDPVLREIIFYANDGNVMAGFAGFETRESYLNQIYIDLLSTTAEDFLSDLYPVGAGDEFILVFATQLKSSYGFDGMVVSIIDPTLLEHVLPDVYKEGKGAFGLVDRQGQIVWRNQTKLEPEQRVLRDDSPARKALAGEVTIVRGVTASIDGSKCMGVNLPIPEIGWAVFVTASVNELIATSRAEVTQRGLVLFGILLLPLMVSWALVNEAITKTKILENTARQISTGDLSVRTNLQGQGELSLVGQAFDFMTNQLEQSQKQRLEQERILREDAERIRESEERFRLLVEGISGYAICMLDCRGIIVSWNTGAESIGGFSQEHALGLHFSEFEPERTKDQVDQLLSQAYVNERVEFSGWGTKKNGTKFWAERLITAIFDNSGQHQGYAVVTRDVTERARFLQIAAHEMRNPMTAILGVLTILMEAELDPADSSSRVVPSKMLIIVQKEVQRLSSMLNDLLEAFNLQEGSIALQVEIKIDLGDSIRFVVESISSELGPESKHCLVFNEQATRAYINGDRRKLEGVWRNLITNAVKYSPDGGDILVSLSSDCGKATVTISDHGVGIPINQQDRVFESFFRASNLKGNDPGGMGLGLYICQMTINKHGGTISLESKEGEGTTFIIELPLWR